VFASARRKGQGPHVVEVGLSSGVGGDIAFSRARRKETTKATKARGHKRRMRGRTLPPAARTRADFIIMPKIPVRSDRARNALDTIRRD